MHRQGQGQGAVRVRLQEPTPAKAGVSVATPATKPKGGQFCAARQGTARQFLRRPHPGAGHRRAGGADRGRDPPHPCRQELAPAKAGGYRGHNHPQKFRVWISGQVRRVTAPIRREMRRRAAVEPVIGHIKAEHRMGRNYLKGATATASTPCSPLPATTSAGSCAGPQSF